MAKKLFGTVRRGFRRKKMAQVFFREGGLLCEQCGAISPAADLQPFTFAPCRKCQFNNFVPLLLDDLLLFEPLGAGGISSVYKGTLRDDPQCLLAVKILKPEHCGEQDIVDAFTEEREIHSQITQHPNVVEHCGGGCIDGVHFYAMAFVQGERLGSLIERCGRLAERDTLMILAQIMAGLRHIYACGFLYRDISANNVILRPDGVAVIIDLGLTLTIEDAQRGHTKSHIWGSGEFLPPERLQGVGEDQVSVIYSLAMLTYYMVTGMTLIKSDTVVGQAKRHLSSVRLALTPEQFPGCSDAMIDLVVTMMQPHREHRYQSFEELEQVVLSLLGAA